MKRIVILGSTGSIGESALRVAKALPEHLEVVGLAARTRGDDVLRQAVEFGVRHVAIADPACAATCREQAPAGVEVLSAEVGLEEMAARDDVDMVLCAVVGMAGLKPVLAALNRGTDVALATKEVLVAAGHIVEEACRRSGARLLPVDSEHSAIFQCLQGHTEADSHVWRSDSVRRLLLTASGGPFFGRADVDFDTVSVDDALNHPRWRMGPKVTIDSATMMNKGLEIIEARWLFDLPVDQIDVIVHPESIVHSMVEFVDGSMIAQLAPPDMRHAIQYALMWPQRMDGGLESIDPVTMGALTFAAPDMTRFPCLALACEAGRVGRTLPTVLNAANEVAVDAFLSKRISFSSIWRIVEQVMQEHQVEQGLELDAVFEADSWARERAGSLIT